jgi:hypothetical protein
MRTSSTLRGDFEIPREVHRTWDFLDAISMPIFGSFVGDAVTDEYKVLSLLGCYAVGSVGVMILVIDLTYGFPMKKHVSVQICYELFQGAAVGMLELVEGELTDGGLFPGIEKALSCC